MRPNIFEIMEINNSNVDKFNRLINQKGVFAIVKYYADWCGHCKILNPKWDDMIEQLRGNKKLKGVLASVSEKYKDQIRISKEKIIEGYPTIRVYYGGKYKYDYRGPRETSDLSRFVKGILGKKTRKTRKRKKKKGKKKRKRRGGRRTRKKKNNTRSALRERFFKMISLK